MSTEIALREWRSGHTLAERLCAQILAVEGFTDIDPQAPIGGPDGGKDILARRDGLKWVAGVYFPPTHSEFGELRTKFVADLEGVGRNDAQAFAFFVNQPLTVGQREELEGLAHVTTQIYHLERIRSILDSPMGFALRLQFLQIPMTAEDQASWVTAFQQGVTAQLNQMQGEIAKVDEKAEAVLERTMIAGFDGSDSPSSLHDSSHRLDLGERPLANLSLELLFLIHRLLVPDSLIPDPFASQLRPVAVTAGAYAAPDPGLVPDLVREFIGWWRDFYRDLVASDKGEVVAALAQLHHRFVSIHPFLDGNGRVGRALIDQAARELLGRPIGPALTADPEHYFAALRQGDEGDLEPLCALIEASLAGDASVEW